MTVCGLLAQNVMSVQIGCWWREPSLHHMLWSLPGCRCVLRRQRTMDFVEDKSKVNADYYMDMLLPKLMDDCHHLLGQQFIFQQDGAPVHAAKSTQQWLAARCPDFINKDAWPPKCLTNTSEKFTKNIKLF